MDLDTSDSFIDTTLLRMGGTPYRNKFEQDIVYPQKPAAKDDDKGSGKGTVQSPPCNIL